MEDKKNEKPERVKRQLVKEIRMDDSLFQSNGHSNVKVTKEGEIFILQLPIKSSGITELIEEFKRHEPRPPVIDEHVKADSDLGKRMGLNKNQWVKMFNLTDDDYIKERERYESELGLAIVIKGLDIELTDADGNVVKDREEKIKVLRSVGMSGEQFTQIVGDIRGLTQWSQEEKEDFFGYNSEETSPSTK